LQELLIHWSEFPALHSTFDDYCMHRNSNSVSYSNTSSKPRPHNFHFDAKDHVQNQSSTDSYACILRCTSRSFICNAGDNCGNISIFGVYDLITLKPCHVLGAYTG